MRTEGTHPPHGGPKLTLVGPATLGWKTGVEFNHDGTRYVSWGDVSPPLEAIVATPLAPMRQIWTVGNVPDYLIGEGGGHMHGQPGSTAGCWHCAYAGTTNGIWMTTYYGVYRSPDGITTQTTSLSGAPVVDPNDGASGGKGFSKGAADNFNANVYYVGLWGNGINAGTGIYRTLDGNNFTKLTWLPAATASYRWSIISINKASSLTAAGADQRRSQVAFAPSGQGVYISSDGGTTGTSIVGSSGITSVSSMWWIGTTLYVIACADNQTEFNGNLYKWTGSGTLVQHNTGLNGSADYGWRFGLADPVNPPGFFLVHANTADWARTTNGTTFSNWLIYNNPTEGPVWSTMRVRPRLAPIISEKFKSGFWAPSQPAIGGGIMLYPTGEGMLSINVADFPTVGDGTFANMPVWTERAGGGQVDGMLVGLNSLWSKDQLWIGNQDIHVVRDEDGRRGHASAIHYFPHNLSDCHGMSKNPNVPGWIVSYRNRLGAGNITPSNSYTTNGHTYGDWHEFSPQFPGPEYSYPPGMCVAGPLGVVWSFNTYNSGGARPQVKTTFAGAPQNLVFWNYGNVLLNYLFDDTTGQYCGNQGGNFSAPHHQACYDWNTNRCWYMNLGSGPTSGAGSWEYDPNGDAGLYATDPGDYVNFRRVSGFPVAHPWLNGGLYDCQLLTDGLGHIVFRQGSIQGTPYLGNNTTYVYTVSTGTWAAVAGVTNVRCMDFGAPYPGLSNPCFWAVGWLPGSTSGTSGWGLFYKPDIMSSACYGPFASNEVQQWGYPKGMAMQTDELGFKGTWGVGALALNNVGGAKFEWTFEAPAAPPVTDATLVYSAPDSSVTTAISLNCTAGKTYVFASWSTDPIAYTVDGSGTGMSQGTTSLGGWWFATYKPSSTGTKSIYAGRLVFVWVLPGDNTHQQNGDVASIIDSSTTTASASIDGIGLAAVTCVDGVPTSPNMGTYQGRSDGGTGPFYAFTFTGPLTPEVTWAGAAYNRLGAVGTE